MIRFKSQHQADVMMFDEVAEHFISLMGHSVTVPSALSVEELEAALQNLRSALRNQGTDSGDWESGEVSLPLRAQPLVKMLEQALLNQTYVLWERSTF